MYCWAVVTSFYVRYTLPYRWIAFATNVYSSLITSARTRERQRQREREREREIGAIFSIGEERVVAPDIYEMYLIQLLANDRFVI